MQRPEGSLCDALADIVGDLAHVVAARTTHGVALSWRPSGPSHHQPLGGSRLPTRAPALPHPQAHYSTLAETRPSPCISSSPAPTSARFSSSSGIEVSRRRLAIC